MKDVDVGACTVGVGNRKITVSESVRATVVQRTTLPLALKCTNGKDDDVMEADEGFEAFKKLVCGLVFANAKA